MKKTKLFTSIAALALVLGLGACEVTSEEETTPSESETTTETTDTEESTPSTGTDEGGNEGEERYFLGLEVSEVNYYFDGTVYNSYYGNANKDISKAVPITVAEYGTGYSLSFVDADGATQYIYMDENEGHHNFKWSESGIYAWDYDETFDTLTTTGSEGTVYFIGCYGTYVEFSLNEYGYLSGDKESSYTQYPAHLYEIPEDWTPYEEPEIDEDDLTTVKTGKLGLFQENKNYYYYFTGAKDGNFAALSTNWEEGVEVTLLTDDTYYYISFLSSGETLYFGHTNSSNSQVAFNSDPYPLQYDTTNGAYLNTDGSRFLGTYSTYETMSWSELQYIGNSGQFKATIYESEQTQPEHEPDPELPEGAITTSITYQTIMELDKYADHTWKTGDNSQDVISSTTGEKTDFEGCSVTWYTGTQTGSSSNGCCIYNASSLRFYRYAYFEISPLDGYEIESVTLNLTANNSYLTVSNATMEGTGSGVYEVSAPTDNALPITVLNNASSSNTITFANAGIVVVLVPSEA